MWWYWKKQKRKVPAKSPTVVLGVTTVSPLHVAYYDLFFRHFATD
jgi:hypothetical protein